MVPFLYDDSTSLLTAWLDKNSQYPLARYFSPGSSDRSYAPPASFGGISGGKVWEAAPSFRAAGVNPEIVRQLERWGAAFTDVAARFQYSGRTPRSRGTGAKKGGEK